MSYGVIQWRRETPIPSASDPPPPQLPGLPEWIVNRPAEIEQIIQALRSTDAATIGITGLYGTGGFGKTTLANAVCADPRIHKRFGGRIYPITMGRDIQSREALAAKVNEVVEFITGQRPSFTDPNLAGMHLGRVLDERHRTLIIIDDVWTEDQLRPFLIGGSQCIRLVTTRIPKCIPHGSHTVLVDQMSPTEAYQLLTWRLPTIEPAILTALIQATGCWPLLLRLINRIIRDRIDSGEQPGSAATDMLTIIAAQGPAAVDELTDYSPVLDLNDPVLRARAVRATLQASISLLGGDKAIRFAELGIFPEDEIVPLSVVAQLWEATAGMNRAQAMRLCRRLEDLSLITLSPLTFGNLGASLHDVIRAFLRSELGPDKIRATNQAMIDSIARTLPSATALTLNCQTSAVAWWEISTNEGYLVSSIVYHLTEARRVEERDALVTDLRWIRRRLMDGPSAPASDLAKSDTVRANSLSRGLSRAAHLLGPTEPPHAIMHILLSRLRDDPNWHNIVAIMQEQSADPCLLGQWPLPDLPDSALRRTLTGHKGWVRAVAISPDGNWLVTSGSDRTFRLYATTNWLLTRSIDTGHAAPVNAVAISPDGTWIATGSEDATVRVWDLSTGNLTTTIEGHAGPVNAVAISPDGTWIATGSRDKTVQVWNLASRTMRMAMKGHQGPVRAMAISPDGTWIATGSEDATVRVWDLSTGNLTTTIEGHAGPVNAVAISPDGTWIATGSEDATVRVWDLSTGNLTTTIEGHAGPVNAVAISPDGTWIATGSRDKTVQVWNLASRTMRMAMKGHQGPVRAMAISPDGTWIATGSNDKTVRIWDTSVDPLRVPPLVHSQPWVWAVAISPDGTWIVTGSSDTTARIWDLASGRLRATLTGHTGGVWAVAISPDGTWIVTGSSDTTARIWDLASGRLRATLTGHTGGVWAVAISPDGTRIVTGSNDGTVRMWDVALYREHAVLIGHIGPVYSVAFCRGGARIISGGDDGIVRLWDSTTAKLVADFTGHTGPIYAAAAGPGESALISAGNDHTARIWNIDTQQVQAILSGHTGPISALAVSANDDWIATAGNDRCIEIWRHTTGERVTLMRVEGPIFGCSWSPKEPTIAAVGKYGIYVFAMRPGTP